MRSLTKILFALLLFLAACSGGDTAHQHDEYTCPMHPTVISDRPSTCPVCGMDLVRKAQPGEELEITREMRPLLQSTDEAVISKARTTRGVFSAREVFVRATGVTTYDQRFIRSIPVRIGGRLEKVNVRYSMQPVRKGEVLARIYSPELLNAQREFLFLTSVDDRDEGLVAGARKKLELLGLSSSQIDLLITSRKPSYDFPLISSQNGYIVSPETEVPSAPIPAAPLAVSSSGGMDGMGGGGQASSTPSAPMNTGVSTSSLPREGEYVQRGQTLFRVVSSDALRAEFTLPSAFNQMIRKGSIMQLDFGDSSVVSGTVDFVEPFFRDGENFIRVRVYTTRLEGLHVGHLVNATANAGRREALWVPRNAVVDGGKDYLVFVKEQGVFKPRRVTVGVTSGDWLEVSQGLSSSEEIAAEAQFLVDSESFIKAE